MLSRLFRIGRQADPDHLDVAHQGLTYRVALRRSALARRYTLRVRSAERDVVLTVPMRGSLRAAREFAASHAGWIAARIARLPQGRPFAPGASIPFRGVEHRLAHETALRGTVRIETAADGAPVIVVPSLREHFARRLTDFLKRQARHDLEAAAFAHAGRLGVTLKRISIKDTTSRWGSCSAKGVLSFSWRLILAPPHVLGYLAAHETAHRVEMNHSSRYWKLLHSISPDVDRAEAWLKRHGAELHLYGG